jgi:hypothetical protein
MPDLNHPNLFGLPNVMEIAVQRFNTEYTFATLRGLNSISDENVKFDREKFKEKLDPFVTMWKRVFAKFQQETTLCTKFLEISEDPVDGFIQSEQNARIDIIKKINDQFTGLEKVLSGNISLTNNI